MKDLSWETICDWFGVDPRIAAALKPDPKESQAELRAMLLDAHLYGHMYVDAVTLKHVPATSVRPLEADTPIIVET